MRNQYWVPSFDEEGRFFQWTFLSNVIEIRPRFTWEDDFVGGAILFFNEPGQRVEANRIDVTYFLDKGLVSQKLREWGVDYTSAKQYWTTFAASIASCLTYEETLRYYWNAQEDYAEIWLNWVAGQIGEEPLQVENE